MLTIKFKLKTDISKEFLNFQKKYNNVYRFAFNRFQEGKSKIQIEKLVKSLNNTEILDSSWKRIAILNAETLYKARQNSKVILEEKRVVEAAMTERKTRLDLENYNSMTDNINLYYLENKRKMQQKNTLLLQMLLQS